MPSLLPSNVSDHVTIRQGSRDRVTRPLSIIKRLNLYADNAISEPLASLDREMTLEPGKLNSREAARNRKRSHLSARIREDRSMGERIAKGARADARNDV